MYRTSTVFHMFAITNGTLETCNLQSTGRDLYRNSKTIQDLYRVLTDWAFPHDSKFYKAQACWLGARPRTRHFKTKLLAQVQVGDQKHLISKPSLPYYQCSRKILLMIYFNCFF